MKTTVSIGDYHFHIDNDPEEEGLMEFHMEEMDYDSRKDEEYVGNYCFALLTPEQLEYIANRILDAVKFKKMSTQKRE